MGISGQTIRNYRKAGKIPRDMLTRRTGLSGAPLYDTEADSYQDFVNRKVRHGGSRKPGFDAEDEQVSTVSLPETSPEERSELQVALQSLTEKWGQHDVVHAWAKVRKELALAEAAEMKTAELQGELIRREFVARHVVGLVDGMARRLLTDIGHTVTKRVAEGARAGKDLAELKKVTHDLIGATIRQAKKEAIDAIERGKPEEEDDASDPG